MAMIVVSFAIIVSRPPQIESMIVGQKSRMKSGRADYEVGSLQLIIPDPRLDLPIFDFKNKMWFVIGQLLAKLILIIQKKPHLEGAEM